MTQSFTGLNAYPITPLTADGGIAHEVLAKIVSSSVAAGVDGITVLASSGAGVTFDRSERAKVLETAMSAAAGRVPVYAAISGQSTRMIEQNALDAKAAGVAGVLLAPFAYLPLGHAEVAALFKGVSDAADIDMCFYNKPLQTKYDLTADVLADLANTSRLVAVKETMRRPDLPERVETLRQAVSSNFSLGLSSDVQLIEQLPDVDAWHTGLAALMPTEYVAAWKIAQTGIKSDAGAAAISRLRQVAVALSESNTPLGAFHALANQLGIPTAPPRGPFAAATALDVERIDEALSV